MFKISSIRDWIVSSWRGFCELLGAAWRHKTIRTLFIVLLVVDFVCIAWYGVTRLLYELDVNTDLHEIRFLRVTEEGGLPEWYNYAKTLLLVGLLGYLARSKRQLVYWAFAILFAVILVDDSFQIHEQVGEYFVEACDLDDFVDDLGERFDVEAVHDIRPQDIGEVMIWGIMGLVLMPLLAVGFVRSSPAHVRNGLALLLPFGALVFCAVVVDQLYASFKDVFFGCGIIIDMAEDGGEMLAITFVCALAAAIATREDA